MQFFTYSGLVNAGVIINSSSYNAVLISSSSIKKIGLFKEAYIYIYIYRYIYIYTFSMI